MAEITIPAVTYTAGSGPAAVGAPDSLTLRPRRDARMTLNKFR